MTEQYGFTARPIQRIRPQFRNQRNRAGGSDLDHRSLVNCWSSERRFSKVAYRKSNKLAEVIAVERALRSSQKTSKQYGAWQMIQWFCKYLYDEQLFHIFLWNLSRMIGWNRRSEVAERQICGWKVVEYPWRYQACGSYIYSRAIFVTQRMHQKHFPKNVFVEYGMQQ